MTEEPLIYTTKGNVPVKDLTVKNMWHDDPDSIVFAREWYLDGELVKREAHVYQRNGIVLEAQKGD